MAKVTKADLIARLHNLEASEQGLQWRIDELRGTVATLNSEIEHLKEKLPSVNPKATTTQRSRKSKSS